MIVYCITNTVNGKTYVGQTVRTLEQRWRQHICVAKTRPHIYLYNALRCYGKDAFVLSVLDTASTQNELNEKEVFHIARLHSNDPQFGYNGTLGGYSETPTDETRNKVSEGLKASWKTRVKPTGDLNPNFGKKHTAATLKKMSTSRIGIRTSKGCSSKYIGVSFHKPSGKWQAQARFNGKTKYLGRFDMEWIAARIADYMRFVAGMAG